MGLLLLKTTIQHLDLLLMFDCSGLRNGSPNMLLFLFILYKHRHACFWVVLSYAGMEWYPDWFNNPFINAINEDITYHCKIKSDLIFNCIPASLFKMLLTLCWFSGNCCGFADGNSIKAVELAYQCNCTI
jgi:hypothetical protein